MVILVEYFLIICLMTSNMVLEAIIKKVRTKTKIKNNSSLVTVDLVLNGSIIFGPT